MKNKNFGWFWPIFDFELKRKRSQAEPKILQLELWLEPAWLGLITCATNMGNFPNIEIVVGFMRCIWFSQTLFSKLSSPTSKSLKERISAPFYSDKKVCYSWKSFRELPVNGLELFQTWVKTWFLDSIKIRIRLFKMGIENNKCWNNPLNICW